MMYQVCIKKDRKEISKRLSIDLKKAERNMLSRVVTLGKYFPSVGAEQCRKGDKNKEPRKRSDKVLEAYWCQGFVSWLWYSSIEDL